MHEYCKPGDTVLKSGIYLVRHADRCEMEHDVVCIFGHVFPRCHECGGEPSFSLVRYAQDVEQHQFFRAAALDSQAILNHPKQHRKVWSPGELIRLKTLIEEGKTKKEAAAELRRSEGAVKARLKTWEAL